MKKHFKKLIAGALCFALVFSLFSAAALAEDTTTSTTPTGSFT